MKPIVIAHRGYKQVTPENTLAAFAAAVAAGADMIETDIHVCKSGEIVIMHDDDVAATSNGQGKISQMTLPELKQLDLGSWFDPAFTGQRIVTLEELVEFFVAHPQTKLLLEFKGDWNEANSRRVVDKLNGGNLRSRTILESFSQPTMAVLHQIAPDYERGLLIEEPFEGSETDRILADCARLDVMCLNPSVEILQRHPELAARCHQAELQVMIWTADRPEQFQLCQDLGIEGICTNRPGFLAGWLATQSGRVA